MCIFKDSLEKLIDESGVKKKTTYSTGEAARILGTSTNTILMLCDNWTPNSKEGLECYRIATHRKIPHHSILEYLKNSNIYKELET